MHKIFWWENLKETDHLEDLGADGNLFKYILKNRSEKVE
jgi:hypothetical protein